MQAEPQKEHQWLQKLVGEWTMEGEADMGPGQPKHKSKGTESVRSLGGLWIVGDGQGEMPGGGAAKMMITLGYDPRTKRFVGTWIGSMMTHLWVYDGELDGAGRVLTLNAEGPSFAGDGTIAKYQDIFEVVNNDHRVLRSRFQQPDGSWGPFFMEAHYRRTGGGR